MTLTYIEQHECVWGVLLKNVVFVGYSRAVQKIFTCL